MAMENDIPKRVVTVTATHYTCDMGINNRYVHSATADATELKPGDCIELNDPDVHSIKVLEITPDSVTLECDGEFITVEANSEVMGRRVLLPNPYLRDELQISVKYTSRTLFDITIGALMEISAEHDGCDGEKCPATAAREQAVLENIDTLIALGNTGLYPLKALLSAADNWCADTIVRPELFRKIFLEGVEKGALAPDCHEGWSWTSYAAMNNNPMEFMADSSRFLRLLEAAEADKDNEEARTVREQMRAHAQREAHAPFYRLVTVIGTAHEAGIFSAKLDEKKKETLALLDGFIAAGETEFYPLKAHLASSDNWSAGIITRPELFREILLEGIEKGALAPDNENGWRFLKAAADYNDPTEFMTDMDRYFDLLMSAVEEGNDDAHIIMDMIWEPENCIEED